MAVRPAALFITLNQAQSFNIKRQLKMLSLTLNIIVMVILTHIYFFRDKSTSEFLKGWNKKFSKSIDKEISRNCLNDNLSIANAFANQFGAVYYDSRSDSKAKQDFFNSFDKYV